MDISLVIVTPAEIIFGFLGGGLLIALIVYGFVYVIKRRNEEGYSDEYLRLYRLILDHYGDELDYGIILEQPLSDEVGDQMKKLKIGCLLYIDSSNTVRPGLQGFVLRRYAKVPSWW